MGSKETGAQSKQMDNARKVFDSYDKNGDGRISFDELRLAMRVLFPSISSDELEQTMQDLDKDGDGTLDFEEFVSALSITEGGQKEGNAYDEDLKVAFSAFDTNGDGRVSAAELQVVLKNLGMHYTVEDCTKMIEQVDSDGDGHVNFEEFRAMMSTK